MGNNCIQDDLDYIIDNYNSTGTEGWQHRYDDRTTYASTFSTAYGIPAETIELIYRKQAELGLTHEEIVEALEILFEELASANKKK